MGDDIHAQASLGIADLDRPDYGDAVEIRPGEVPVFWACGVTPQAVVMSSRYKSENRHSKLTMLITCVHHFTFYDILYMSGGACLNNNSITLLFVRHTNVTIYS